MKRLTCAGVLLSLFIQPLGVHAQNIVPPSPDYWFAFASRLPIGATVTVRTSDGKRQTAVLARVDQDSITLQPRTRIPEPPRRIPFDQLEQLELKQNGSSVAKAVAIGVATGAGTFFGIMMVMLAIFSD